MVDENLLADLLAIIMSLLHKCNCKQSRIFGTVFLESGANTIITFFLPDVVTPVP
jgi:hypothetical protein